MQKTEGTLASNNARASKKAGIAHAPATPPRSLVYCNARCIVGEFKKGTEGGVSDVPKRQSTDFGAWEEK